MEPAGFGALSLLPPLLAIALAIYSRRVYLSLAAGIWLGWTIVAGWDPGAGLADAIDATVAVLGEPDNARVLLFTFAIGGLIAVIERNGGMRGFVEWVERREWVTTGRRAQLMAWLLGFVIFIESNLTILVAGAVSRPLFDRFRLSREKLAYIIDSTSAPVCILIPFNAWGAFILGIMAGLEVEAPLSVFLGALPLNFYALAAVALAGSSAYLGLDWGPMAEAQARAAGADGERALAGDPSLAVGSAREPVGASEGGQMAPASEGDGRGAEVPEVESAGFSPVEGIPRRPVNMALPIAIMVASMPVAMWITGGGNLAQGSGSTSVLWAVGAGLAVAWLLSVGQRLLSLEDLSSITIEGAGGLTGMALVLLLALALADVTGVMGTGTYVAGVVGDQVPTPLLLPLLFLTAGGIAFATGSSWGTFAIVLPLSLPLAGALELPPSPFLAAVLSGGIFGDHCSPISDTTIIASLASATDHIDHVRTQLPYALTAGAVAALGFAIVGGWLAL